MEGFPRRFLALPLIRFRMNRIPQSLGKPFLRDAIVELRFVPQVASNLLPGIFYERLRQHGWHPPSGGIQSTIALNFGITASTVAEPIFTKEGFRLHVMEDRILFNINGTYPGWKKVYRPLLDETLPVVLTGDQVTPTRVSLRYINDIPTPNIFEVTGRFTNEPLQQLQTKNKAMRWSMRREEIDVVLNMASHLAGDEEGPSSVIDVDLQLLLTKDHSTDAAGILQLVDRLHMLNKEIIFGHLLPEPFLLDFDPTYPTTLS